MRSASVISTCATSGKTLVHSAKWEGGVLGMFVNFQMDSGTTTTMYVYQHHSGFLVVEIGLKIFRPRAGMMLHVLNQLWDELFPPEIIKTETFHGVKRGTDG